MGIVDCFDLKWADNGLLANYCSCYTPKTDYEYISDFGFIPSSNDVGRVSKITFGQIDYSMWKRAKKEGLWGTLNPAEQGNHQGKAF